MKTQDLDKIEGATARETIRLRRNAIKAEQENLNPPRVPRAYPPTTTAEVPPGFADIRAVPVKRADGSQPEAVQISNVDPVRRVNPDALKDDEVSDEMRETAELQANRRRRGEEVAAKRLGNARPE